MILIMPQSLSVVYIHLIFSTKERRPFLQDPTILEEVHKYLGGISRTLDCVPIITGGKADHIHLLARFGRTITQAEWVKELKRVSNLWIKKDFSIREFRVAGWLRGFFCERVK